MGKDFKEWHLKKSDLNENKTRVFFHEREVWFAVTGVNIGFEQDGKGTDFLRPVIVIKKFSNEVFLAVPTTKNGKIGKYYYSFTYKEGESTTAILSQIRLIDCKRLKYRIGSVSEEDFLEIKMRITSFLK